MKLSITAIASVALAATIASEVVGDKATQPKGVIQVDEADALRGLVRSGPENSVQRRDAANALRHQHESIVRELSVVVDADARDELFTPKELAARLLGEMGAQSAIPALTRNLDFRVLAVRTEIKEFYFDEYPCADAIRQIGPSALKQFFAEIVNRNEPLTDEQTRIAAYLVYVMCDDVKEGAIDKVREAEMRHGENAQLQRIRKYIEEVIGVYNVPRSKALKPTN